MDLDLNDGEWRLLSETHNPPAGRNGSSPPSPAAPRGRRPPASLQRTADRAAAAPTAKRMGNPATLPRSEGQDGSPQRRAAAAQSAKGSGNPAALPRHEGREGPRRPWGPPTAFASPSKDAITSRGVSVPPSKTPSRCVPPRRAMRRLGASALLQALPRAQSLALRRRKF